MEKIKKNKFILIFSTLCVLLFVKNNYFSFGENSVLNDNMKVNYEDTKDSDESPESTKEALIVDIKGAVLHPGIYEMKVGDRVYDVINKSGGMTHSNTECVNLSKRVEDEEVIVIPEKDTKCESGNSLSQEVDGAVNGYDKININSADSSKLQTLQGIGEKKADDIISYREQNGFFENIEDLKNVEGIGDSTFDNIKDNIIV